MRAFIDTLRHTLRLGTWLTRERMCLIACAVLIASAGGLCFLLATATGLNDYQGRPLGTDFSNVYAAGTYVIEGKPVLPFDPAAQYAREQTIFGASTPFYGWHYPPFFLFVAGLLALMPYALALAIWQSVTLALYLLSIRAVLNSEPGAQTSEHGKIWILFAVSFPAVFVNLGHGHNGFLTAALFGFALVALNRRPILAGILFGLLAYKPQFGLMIPLVLVASGRWRSFFAAVATVGTLLAGTTLAFGGDIWSAFFSSMHFTRTIVLEMGDTGWHKIQSIFSWARMWGVPIPFAYAVQGAVMLVLAACLVWLWRSRAAFAVKAAALIVASFLATPYSLDYDMMVLAPAIAFLVAHGAAQGFAPWEKTAIAALWFVPLIARVVAEQTLMPLGVIATIVVFVLVMHRAFAQTSQHPAPEKVAFS